MKTIHLEHTDETANIGRKAFPGYTGRKFRVRVSDIPIDTRSYWGDGSRDYFVFVSLADSRASMPVPAQSAFDKRIPGAESVTIPEGFACVEHSIFCGKDMGLTIHINPANAANLLPAPSEITDDEKTVLEYTATFKNSYGGRSNIRFIEARQDKGITTENWETAKASLIEKKMLKKNGSITPAGRNANPAK